MDALTYLRKCQAETRGTWNNASHWVIGEAFIKRQDITSTDLSKMGFRHSTYKHALDKLRTLGFRFERMRKGKIVTHRLLGVEIGREYYAPVLTKEQKLWRQLLSGNF